MAARVPSAHEPAVGHLEMVESSILRRLYHPPGRAGGHQPTASPVGRASRTSNFSTGNDSPVSADWVTNRSFAEINRTSAGVMSPADSCTISPGTSRLNFRRLAVAHYRCGDMDHRFESCGRGIRARLLHKPQADTKDQHQYHHRTCAIIAGSTGDSRQCDQQNDQ